jgi:hypothetical protein
MWQKVLEFLNGKKTYAIGTVVAGLGLCAGEGWFTVPNFVWEILGGLGLAFLRAAVDKSAQAVKDAQAAAAGTTTEQKG